MAIDLDTANSVALYWDFENLHASLVDQLHGQGAYQASRFQPQQPTIDVASVVAYAKSFGPIAVNRAYGNWLSFSRYRTPLLVSAVELIQIFPPGSNAKNGADIKLCLDALEDVTRLAHIATVIVVGGDSDYMPLSYKIKAAGRSLVGIGSRPSTNEHWARSCHEFTFYEQLGDRPGPSKAVAADQTHPSTSAHELLGDSPEPLVTSGADLIAKAITQLALRKGDPWVQKARIRPYIQRLDPTFNESEHGFSTFADMLSAHTDRFEVRRGEHDQEVRLRASFSAEG